MTTTVQIKNILGTYVDDHSGNEAKNYATNNRILLNNFSGETKRGYIFFALPAPAGYVYKNTHLILHNSRAITGNKTLTIKRLTSKYDNSKVTWNNKPTSTSTGAVSVTKSSGAAADEAWDFDITALLNSVPAGQWFGLELTFTNTAVNETWYFHNQLGTASLVPVLNASWSNAPDAPKSLVPSDGRAVSIAKPVLTFDYTDPGGNTLLAAVQVQIHTTTDFTTPGFDSGEVATDTPQLDLNTTAYSGITAGTTRYWRVRVKDNENNWSDWSNPTAFTRVAKGTITITNPPVGGVIYDATPTLLWTVSGATQDRYQVLIYGKPPGGVDELVYDSGKLTSSVGSHTVADNAIKDLTWTYRVVVKSWDNVNRVSTQGDDAAMSAERAFTVTFSGSTLRPTNLVATPDATGKPKMVLTWNISSVPDSIQILRDGVYIRKDVNPAEVFVSGTSYTYTDTTASPNEDHTYEVASTVNGVTSSGNPTDTDKLKTSTMWLVSTDGQYVVPLVNYSQSLTQGEDSATVSVLDSEEYVTVYQGQHGLSGDVSGQISGVLGGLTAAQYMANLEAIWRAKGIPCRLVWANRNIPVVVSKVTWTPKVTNEEIMYVASFFAVEKKNPALVLQP